MASASAVTFRFLLTTLHKLEQTLSAKSILKPQSSFCKIRNEIGFYSLHQNSIQSFNSSYKRRQRNKSDTDRKEEGYQTTPLFVDNINHKKTLRTANGQQDKTRNQQLSCIPRRCPRCYERNANSSEQLKIQNIKQTMIKHIGIYLPEE